MISSNANATAAAAAAAAAFCSDNRRPQTLQQTCRRLHEELWRSALTLTHASFTIITVINFSQVS